VKVGSTNDGAFVFEATLLANSNAGREWGTAWSASPAGRLRICSSRRTRTASRSSSSPPPTIPNLGTPPPAVSTLAWRNRDLALVAVGGVPPADLAALRDAFTR
jgi:hypothetical protein